MYETLDNQIFLRVVPNLEYVKITWVISGNRKIIYKIFKNVRDDDVI